MRYLKVLIKTTLNTFQSLINTGDMPKLLIVKITNLI
jgi:hypothetical protein